MIAKFLIFLFSISALQFAFASESVDVDVIYGEDDRLDVIEASDNLHIELSTSTAAMISPSSLKEVNSSWGGSGSTEQFVVSGPTMIQRGMCKSERFAHQMTAARCSGFLVGEDLLVTAGHCVRSTNDCTDYKWVFNYKIAQADSNVIKVAKEDVFGCKEIVEQKLEGWGSDKDDFALIRLDRKAKGIRPLEFRKEGKPEVNDKLVVIGHPTGLPTKISAGAWVRSLDNGYFSANLDTYGGNSGSAVFNATTGVVEGILVRGAQDYVYDSAQGCKVSNRLGDESGTGEEVTYITNISALMNP